MVLLEENLYHRTIMSELIKDHARPDYMNADLVRVREIAMGEELKLWKGVEKKNGAPRPNGQKRHMDRWRRERW